MLCCCRALAKGQMKNYWITIALEVLLMNPAGLAEREHFSQGEIEISFEFVLCLFSVRSQSLINTLR